MSTNQSQTATVSPGKSTPENSQRSSKNQSLMTPSTITVNSPFSSTLSQPFSLKLDRNNFPLWKTMVFTIIRGHRLEGYLNGQKTCPAEYITVEPTEGGEIITIEEQLNPEYEAWIVHDQLLMGWLYGSMTETIASEVMGCKSASALWTALEVLYGAHSKANMDDLRTKLQTTRKGAQTMTDYLKMKRMWADSLALAGDPYPEKHLIANILSGLDMEYLSIVLILENRSDLSWQELQGALLSFDSKLERLGAVSPNSKTLNNFQANMAQKPFYSGGRGGFGNSFGRSNNQNAPNRGSSSFSNHQGRGNPNSNRGRGRQGRDNTKPTCQVCGKYGHSAAVCYFRYNDHYMGQPPQGESQQNLDRWLL